MPAEHSGTRPRSSSTDPDELARRSVLDIRTGLALACARESAEKTAGFLTSLRPRPMPPVPFALSPERDRELAEILTRYPTKMGACIPALHLCQEQQGYVDDAVVDWVSHRLDLPPAHVKGVVTFYTLFNQHKVGRHQVWICRTLPCALRGAGDLLHHCERKLGIKAGETTEDGKVTLRTAECLASCGTAPMMQVDKDYHENLTLARVDQILDKLRS
jgi:NADH-quinone oxidoreductase subunit E